MKRNGSLTDAGIASLAELRGLHSLKLFYFRSASILSGSGVLPLIGLERLRELSLCGAMADDAVLTEIGRARRLKRVELQWSIASDDGFAALAGCDTIEKLYCATADRMTSRGFAALKRLSRLSWLNFGGAGLGDQDIAAISNFPCCATCGRKDSATMRSAPSLA